MTDLHKLQENRLRYLFTRKRTLTLSLFDAAVKRSFTLVSGLVTKPKPVGSC